MYLLHTTQWLCSGLVGWFLLTRTNLAALAARRALPSLRSTIPSDLHSSTSTSKKFRAQFCKKKIPVQFSAVQQAAPPPAINIFWKGALTSSLHPSQINLCRLGQRKEERLKKKENFHAFHNLKKNCSWCSAVQLT